MQRASSFCSPTSQASFNPHRPRRAGATGHPVHGGDAVHVSILTGPGGPVQPPSAGGAYTAPAVFQSSPAPEGRCNAGIRYMEETLFTFQSSPAPEGRCNAISFPLTKWTVKQVSILTGPGGPVQQLRGRLRGPGGRFNPHRPRRAGATCGSLLRPSALSCFNPHRPRRAGATVGSHRRGGNRRGHCTPGHRQCARLQKRGGREPPERSARA